MGASARRDPQGASGFRRSEGLATARRLRTAPTPVALGTALALATTAWMPAAAVIGFAAPTLAGCGSAGVDCPELLAPIQGVAAAVALAVLALVPSLARAGTYALVGALAVAIPMLLVAAFLGVLPPAPPIAAAGLAVVLVAYVVTGAWALMDQRSRRLRWPPAGRSQ